MVHLETQMPSVLPVLQIVVEDFANEGVRQPTADLVANAWLGKAGLWFGQLGCQAAQILGHLSQRGRNTVQLFAGKAGRVPQHAYILLPVDPPLLGCRPDAGMGVAADRKLL